ncbi:MAG: SRPBCC domain-containing protein [Gallionella sp.]
MIDIIHRIGIKAPVAQVYKGLATLDGLAQWWTEEVLGEAQVGGKIAFVFHKKTGEMRGQIDMEVRKLEPQKEVRWRCIGGIDEWIGTDINFQLSEQDNQTIVMFSHRNWRAESEFTAHCSTKWATFLLSLREYLETGTGRPAPNDQPVDNWD